MRAQRWGETGLANNNIIEFTRVSMHFSGDELLGLSLKTLNQTLDQQQANKYKLKSRFHAKCWDECSRVFEIQNKIRTFN